MRKAWAERFAMWVAWHLPRAIVHWAVVRAWVFSQSGKYGGEHPTDVRTFETVQRWTAGDH